MEPFDLLTQDAQNFWRSQSHPHTLPMILSGRRTGKTFMQYHYNMSLPGRTPPYLKIHGLYLLDRKPFGGTSDAWCWTKAQLTYLLRTSSYPNKVVDSSSEIHQRVRAETGWFLLDHTEVFLNFTLSRVHEGSSSSCPTTNGHMPDPRCLSKIAWTLFGAYETWE